MSEINKEACGGFIAALRKERGWTQRELAERLFVSDKAVSKWERGLSLPDITLLQPMSELLGVSITELLRGERTESARPMPADQVERLMAETIRLSAGEKERRETKRRRWRIAYIAGAAVSCAELALLRATGASWEEMGSTVLVVVGLGLLFGAWLCFWARESLPAYYDGNRINFYSDGVFRINVPGLRFNNSNWPHILNALRGWLLGAQVIYPPLWGALHRLLWGRAPTLELFLTLLAFLGVFLPIYVVGKKYE